MLKRILKKYLLVAVNEIKKEQEGRNIYKTACKLATESTAQYVLTNLSNVLKFQDGFALIDHALGQTKLNGLYLEFGVFKGASINYIAKQIYPKKIYGFDSFEGLPEDWRTDFKKGTFALDHLPKVNDNVELVKGWFDKSIIEFKNNHSEPCAFIHVDSDLYSSAATLFELLNDRITPGTVLVFDEYFNYPGWEQGEFKVFQEFIKRTNLKYKYIGYNENHEQCAVIIL